MTAALSLLGITKRFGSVTALDGADFVLAPGEIHGLLGENGAGKSTLMHIAFGLIRPDEGRIEVGGRPVAFRSPEDARRQGLGLVHQHFTSVPALTVAENLWLAAGRYGADAGWPAGQDEGSAVGRLRRRLWQGLDPSARVETLTVSGKQRLELLQAVATDARVLLLDEPTAVLAPPEVSDLLGVLREFAAAGGSAVFITHKLGEILAVADRVTVLRGGRVTSTGPVAGATSAGLAAAMVGGGAEHVLTAPVPRGALRPDREPVVRHGDLEIRPGEIVGLAAVEGNGQRELLRAVAGIIPRPAEMRVSEPVAFIPEDRTTEGLAPGFSLVENMVLGLQDDPRWRRGPWLNWARARDRTQAMIPEFGIRTSGAGAATRTLSGGNQQKLVLGRALEAAPRVLVAENPTRGLDVHASRFVHERLRAAAASGMGVLFYSADLDEVLVLASRIVVMYRGIRHPVAGSMTREDIGALMAGAGQ